MSILYKKKKSKEKKLTMVSAIRKQFQKNGRVKKGIREET